MLSLLLPLFLPVLAVLLPLVLIAGLLRAPMVKGYLGELWMRVLIHRHLPTAHYHALHDVTLPTVDGSTQIDHIIVSRFGVFVLETLARLHQGRMAPGLQSQQQHLRHLQQRSDPLAQRRRPRCGNALVLRTRRNGNKAGQQFWGCSSYPGCRAMQSL